MTPMSSAAMAPGAAANPRLGRAEWRVILLSSFGGGLEIFDFIVYGVFAAYISREFFPAADPLVSLVNTFAVFAGGYLIRPIGGIVLSHYGDRFGRRTVFTLSLLVMSLATLDMGLIPSYATWGATGTILFILLRLTQGFCVGGEMGGAVTYIVEAAPQRAGFGCSILFCLSGLGVAAASLVNVGVQAALPSDQAAAYGWRIAFIVGGLLGVAGFWVRNSLEESPAFEQLRGHVVRTPLVVLLRDHWRPFLVSTGIGAVVGALNGLLFVHMPGLLIRVLGYPGPAVANAVTLSILTLSVVLIGIGWLSDQVPRRWLFRAGCVAFVVGAWPAYQALAGRGADLIPIFVAIGLVGAFTNGTFGAIMADLFPTRVRFSGVAVSYALAMAIFQGFTPLVATLLIERTGTAASPAFWMAGIAALSIVSSLWLKRFEGRLVQAEVPA